MFDDANRVFPVFDRLSHLVFESREPIDQGRHAASEANGIAETAAGSASPVRRQVDNGDALDQSRWKVRRRVEPARLAENDQVDDVRAGQVVEERSAP